MFRFKTVGLQRCLGVLWCVQSIDAEGVQLNDFNVTIQSARYTPPTPQVGFSEIGSLKHNHTTAGKKRCGEFGVVAVYLACAVEVTEE